ncbi:MAG: hypothetical protein COA79_07920, partial [Planctomycetota bacterium]
CAMGVDLKSLVRENRTQGSVRGTSGNGCSYLYDLLFDDIILYTRFWIRDCLWVDNFIDVVI